MSVEGQGLWMGQVMEVELWNAGREVVAPHRGSVGGTRYRRCVW